jgi:anti-anti-sigma factor
MEVGQLSVSHPLAPGDVNARVARVPDAAAAPEAAADRQKPQPPPPAEAGARSILPVQVIAAPKHLGLESRIAFREAASALVDRITTGTGLLVIDCSSLKSIDSAGLNALILVQRRAAKRRIRVLLRDLSEEHQALLVLTKLDDLFELQDG